MRLSLGFPPHRLPHFDRSCCPFASGTPGADCSLRRASLVVVGGVGVGGAVAAAVVVVVVVFLVDDDVGRSGNGLLGPWYNPMVGEGGGRVPWRRHLEQRVGNASGILKGSSAVGRRSRMARFDVS